MNPSIRWLDWRFVRSLGELQILTRASYAMLGVVPILAGVWNALPLDEPRSHYLTHTWVFAFFAALGVTFGQVIYQTLAPEIVRRSTRDQFVREKRDEYAKQPSRELLEAADLALDRNTHQQLSFPRFVYYYPPVENITKIEALIGEAIKTANRMNEDTVNKLGSLFIECVKDHSDYATREAFYRISRSKLYSYDNYLARLDIPYRSKEHWDHLFTEINQVIDSIGYTDLDNLLHNTAKVGYAANLNYMMEANRRFPIMLLASILYLTAVGLIFVIMVDQIGAVLTAAGWW